MKYIACIYDRISESYAQPMTFDNDMLPYAQCRRNMRDLYLEGKVTYDQLTDRDLVVLAIFDPITGNFENIDRESYSFASMVADLEACKDEVPDCV